LSVFKHFVFVRSWWTDPLFSCYVQWEKYNRKFTLKIEEKLIKAEQRETNCRLKLRRIALEILICLSLHDVAKVNFFYK
jgi:hypothetical protein